MTLVLLVSAGISFTIEHLQIQHGTETAGHIIAKHGRPYGGGLGDLYEIEIEYQAHGQRKHFRSVRALGDTRKFNVIGTAVPVLHLDNGKAFINGFIYLYPITATLLVLTAIAGVSTLFVLLFIPQSRFEAAAARARQYQQAKRSPRQRLSANRRLLLSRLHRWLFFSGGMLAIVVMGFLRTSAWIVLVALAGAALSTLIMRRMLVCPHCGASLANDLKELEPSVVRGRTNWLTVRDYLAKGVPVTCSHCGRSLDE